MNIDVQPNEAKILADTLFASGDYTGALKYYESMPKTWLEGACGAAECAMKLRKDEFALGRACDAAIMFPKSYAAMQTLGNYNLYDRNPVGAEEAYVKSLRFLSTPEVHRSLAIAQMLQYRYEDARSTYEAGIAQFPTDLALKVEYGMLLLLLKDPRGPDLYGMRFAARAAKIRWPEGAKIITPGSIGQLDTLPVDSHLMVVCEQGLGDSVMALLPIWDLMKRVKYKISVSVQDEMYRYYRKHLRGIADVYTTNSDLPSVSHCVASMDLVVQGRWFRERTPFMPAFGWAGGTLVCLEGNRRHPQDRYRSYHGDGADFVESRISSKFKPYNTKGAYIVDVLDLDTYIRGARAVVTVDTLTAHLAGINQIPTYILLGKFIDWRWGDLRGKPDISQCEAYPTVKLVKTDGHFSKGMEMVNKELEREASISKS